MNNVVCKTACNAKIKEKAEEIEEEETVLEMEIAWINKNSFLSLFHRQIMTLSLIRQMKIVEINFDLIWKIGKIALPDFFYFELIFLY